MYKVILDGKVLYDTRLSDYRIHDPKVQLEVNKTGGFDFKIYPQHPRYNQIDKLTSIIEVYQRDTLLFRGRPLNDGVDFDNGKKVECEGELAYLNDTIIRPYEYSGSVEGYVEMLIEQHNEQVEEHKKFEIGNVTVTDPNDYIVRADSQFLSTWQIINAKLIKLLGGYIMVRRSGGVNYIDYLEDSVYISQQPITLGSNLLDLNQSLKGEQIVTALIPTGATIQVEDEETGDVIDEYKVTIDSVNDGVDYVHHQAAVDRWGWIYKHMEYENITLPENLKARAITELDKLVNYTENITISAIDLNMIDADFHRFKLFEYVKVKSELHNIDENYLIRKQTIHLTNPKENKITIGVERPTITEGQVNVQDELNVIRDENVKTNEKVGDRYNRLTHTITETAERFTRELRQEIEDEVDGINQSMTTQFQQTARDFTFLFNSLSEALEDLSTGTQNQFIEILKYIRFVNGTIVLGETNNPVTLEIQNDRISFKQNNTEVAYINDSRLYITSGVFLERLRIGQFGFTPRDNGSLTLGKL